MAVESKFKLNYRADLLPPKYKQLFLGFSKASYNTNLTPKSPKLESKCFSSGCLNNSNANKKAIIRIHKKPEAINLKVKALIKDRRNPVEFQI